MTRGISAYTVIRNAIAGDFCLRECIQSLLPVCDELVVGEAASTDGTAEMLEEWAEKEPKLRILHQPWRQAVNEPDWYLNWINATRQALVYDQQLYLDADEVLDSGGYNVLRNASSEVCYKFYRINFWRDAKTVIGKGETCGFRVTRFGPTELFMPSDEPYGDDAPEILKRSVPNDKLIIFHYGFLRSLSGIIAKCKVGLTAQFGGFDPRLARAALHPEKPWHSFLKHELPYTEFRGEHPAHCLPWLKAHHAL